MGKPILCLDFDGVIHRYDSGWKGADVIPDPPVDGAIAFMLGALNHFDVVIFSSRSNQPGGIAAMRSWLKGHAGGAWYESPAGTGLEDVRFATEKPAAMITIDDRALTFDGVWPDLEALKKFKPWNKREIGATGRFPQGKLNDHDEGELRMAIAYDKLDGIVRLEFGKPVAWLGLPPPQAIQFAERILWHARKAK
ncbi:MAG: hypothetical protein IT537_03370 [Hyphomicrobiales bacterium]|nr:hypothetical protein [Hyphomicrobiales bacterium]